MNARRASREFWRRLRAWWSGAGRGADWPERVDQFAANTAARLTRTQVELSRLRQSLSEIQARLEDRQHPPAPGRPRRV